MASSRRLTDNRPWAKQVAIESAKYTCGYCGLDVASERGWETDTSSTYRASVRICPDCWGPTFFSYGGHQYPGPLLGNRLQALPKEIAALYDEARGAAAAQSYTAAVMVCRKILMHVAVEKGATKDLSFKAYVGWLISERFVPLGAEAWLDYVRERANEANHEIVLMSAEDAKGVILLTQALLHAVYELPAAVPPIPKPKGSTQ